MIVNQTKPFNPILGETFQAKIGDKAEIYLEQSSHHPPRSHFILLGGNYRCYGYNEPIAKTSPNSVEAISSGIYNVEYFTEGSVVKHTIIAPIYSLAGLMIGTRKVRFSGKLCVVDERNDYVCIIEMNPDERGLFSKLMSSKKTFPDYFKGFVTKKSSCTFDGQYYTANKNATKFIEIEGDWTTHIKVDGETMWDLKDVKYSNLRRTCYTLPSDSTFRDDVISFKEDKMDKAQANKIKLEEIQRNDRKLRKKYSDRK